MMWTLNCLQEGKLKVSKALLDLQIENNQLKEAYVHVWRHPLQSNHSQNVSSQRRQGEV